MGWQVSRGDEPQAVVREVNGQLVLDDPAALGMIQAVEAHNRGIAKKNCAVFLEQNRDRIAHFVERMKVLGRTPEEVVIVVIDVDDHNGGPIAELLMPGHNWQQERDKGLVPVARGLAERAGIQEVLQLIDAAAAEYLQSIKGPAVVVISDGTADAYEATP